MRHRLAPCVLFHSLALISACVALAGAAPVAFGQPESLTPEAEALIASLPDYSYAGYDFGESAIPDVRGPIFDVTLYGAVPDDGRPDRAAIQAAIDAAEKAGGGVVLFPAGRFDLADQDPLFEVLHVKASNIVMRGAGAGPGGTELYLDRPTALINEKISWSNQPMLRFEPDQKAISSLRIREADGHAKAELAAPVAAGESTLQVDDASGFAVGDIVSLAIESTAVNERFLEGLGVREKWTRIRERGVVVNELHLITAIDGNRLTFRAPILVDAYPGEGWSIIARPMLRHCGVEDIHFRGNFTEPFVHHKNYIHDNGYLGVRMVACFRSWVRRCRFSDLSGAAIMTACLASAILDCEYTGNPGHTSFGSSFGTRNLIGRCTDHAGTWHGPAASHMAAGTVIWRYRGYVKRGGYDFHATSPRHTLIDASRSVEFLNSGGAVGSLPNHLDKLTFWNCYIDSHEHINELNFWDLLEDAPEQRYGPVSAVRPNFIGLSLPEHTEIIEPIGRVVPAGAMTLPDSLYEHQLEQRLGARPAWLNRAR